MAIRFETANFNDSTKDVKVAIATSASEMAAAVKAASDTHPDAHGLDLDSSWLGRKFSSDEEAVKAVSLPWDEGITRISEMLVELRKEVRLPKPVSLKRQKVWSDEDGDEIDFDRLRSGEPFYRTTKKSNAIRVRQITLIVDIGGAASRSPDELMWRGVAAVALAKLLEDAGYRVEIWTIQAARGGFISGKGNCVLTQLKGMKDRLNIGTIASCVSAWYFRTVGFLSYNLYRDEEAKSSLGNATEDYDEMLNMIEPDADKRLVIKGLWSRDACGAIVKETIERLNSEANAMLAAV
jgi:hypothetical protein